MPYIKVTRFLFLILVVFGCKPKVSDLTFTTDQLNQYELFEVGFKMDLPYDDPYNANDIQVDLVVKRPTTGSLLVPCYYASGASGNSLWNARFTPRQEGVYRLYIHATNGKDVIQSEDFSLNVSPSDMDGFIKLDTDNNFTFRFDSGKPFRGIGENFGWETGKHDNPNLKYDYMFGKFAEYGMNVTRTWMCPWNLPLEWKKPASGNPLYKNDSSTFNMSAIDRMEFMIREAEKNGVYVILVLDYHGAIKTEPDYWGSNNFWIDHNYNIANGGSAETPEDFFTDQDAIDLYKNRLRYLIARWGYSTNILAWEFWNEIDNAAADEKIRESAIINWHNEMAKYLENSDPYNHIVTSSVSHRDISGLFALEDIDISQTHPYGSTLLIPDIINEMTGKYSKPYIVGEFGYDWRDVTEERLPDFVSDLQKGLWLGLFSNTPVLPMTWWWETYDKLDIYDVFRSVSIFSNMMTSGAGNGFKPVKLSCPEGINGYALEQGDSIFGYLLNTTTTEIFQPIRIIGLEGIKYELNIFNTDDDKLENIADLSVKGGVVSIEIFKLEPGGDIAMVLKRIE